MKKIIQIKKGITTILNMKNNKFVIKSNNHKKKYQIYKKLIAIIILIESKINNFRIFITHIFYTSDCKY